MSEEPRRVYRRPPVEGTDEELDEWVEAFLDTIIGQEATSDEE